MSAALLEKLIEAGTPVALVAEVAAELARAQAAQELLEQRRAKDRERKRLRNSEDSEEGAEFQEKVPSEVSPPAPPLPTNLQTAPLSPPSQEEKLTAVGKCLKRAFPIDLPDWMPESYAEFRAMRKSMRNVPFSPGAERRCIAKLSKLRDEGHDPEKLLSKAIERGHRTFFEDETTKAGPGQRFKTAVEWRQDAEWYSRRGDREHAEECRQKAIELESRAA